jgi:hypothetical protein
MLVDRLIRKLLPRSESFFTFFEQDVENLVEACRALRELLDARTTAERDRLVSKIEALEHRGDELTHTIYRELSLTFITPIDREDIGLLASAFDNIMDNIDRAACSIQLYQVVEFDQPVRDLAEIIQLSVGELQRAVPLMRDLRDAGLIREACIRINAHENEADRVFHRALAVLFQDEQDAIRLIKKKEILATLETATDRCEDAAVMIESILVKQD